MSSRTLRLSSSLLFALALLLAAVLPVAAQETPPPPLTDVAAPPVPGARQVDGDWYVPAGSAGRMAVPAGADAINLGPDQFGYVASDAPVNWIDARDGTALGFSGYSRGQFAQVGLPFAFPFYENSYTSLWINAPGYLSFSPAQEWWPNQLDVVLPDLVNDIVAPYPTVLGLAASGSANRVFYRSGGSAPNRYFVVEWYRVKGYDHHANNEHTFEVVLYENGDIWFQYQTMEYDNGWWCGSAKMENALGTDGLQPVRFCDPIAAPSAVKFTRPGAAARVMVYPLDQGRFSRAAFTESYPITIQNTGALGSDRYNLSASGGAAVRFIDEHNVLLADSNGDGVVDTGPLAPGVARTFRAQLVTAPISSPGQMLADVAVQVRSVLNAGVSRGVTLRAMTAPGFVEAYSDYTWDGQYSDSDAQLHTAHPAGPATVSPSAQQWGGALAVATLPGTGYVTAWSGPNSGDESATLRYALHSPDGARTFGGQLPGAPPAGMKSVQTAPAVAVAPNGRAGIVWLRTVYRWANNRWEFNDNIYFAIVNAATGAVIRGPTDLTHNDRFGYGSEEGTVEYYGPAIAATGDNRFVVAAQRGDNLGGGDWISNVGYGVLDDAGNVVRDVTPASVDDGSRADRAYRPSLTALGGNRVLLAYDRGGFMVLSSGGGVLWGFTSLEGYAYDVDVEQLGNGNLLFAYTMWDYGAQEYLPAYELRDGNSYYPLYGPAWLSDEVDIYGPSVTRDAAGNGVVTWMSADTMQLRVRLVRADGALSTPAMPFVGVPLAAALAGRSLWLRYPYNAHSAPLAVAPTSTGQPDPFVLVDDVSGGTPGGTAVINATVVNRGQIPATGVVLSAALPDELSYVSAVPAPTGVVPAGDAPDAAAGTTVIWNLPDLAHLGGGRVQLVTTVPSTTIGADYTVDFTLTAANSPVDPAHGQDSTTVVEMLPTFLPVVGR